MMARRSPSFIVAQRAISSMVRPQPTHSPVSPWSRQTLTQGVSKEVPADYPGDYVGIGAARGQKASEAEQTTEGQERPSLLLRRLAWCKDPRRIGPNDDDIGLCHALCCHELIERGGVRQREPHASVGHRRAETGMIGAMDAVTSLGEEDRMRHAGVVPLLGVVHDLHAERRVGAGGCREAGSAGRYAPAINRSAVDRHGHGLARLVDLDENIGKGWLACRASEAQPEQRQGNKPRRFIPLTPRLTPTRRA